ASPVPMASKIFHTFSARLRPTSWSTSSTSMRLRWPTYSASLSSSWSSSPISDPTSSTNSAAASALIGFWCCEAGHWTHHAAYLAEDGGADRLQHEPAQEVLVAVDDVQRIDLGAL